MLKTPSATSKSCCSCMTALCCSNTTKTIGKALVVIAAVGALYLTPLALKAKLITAGVTLAGALLLSLFCRCLKKKSPTGSTSQAAAQSASQSEVQIRLQQFCQQQSTVVGGLLSLVINRKDAKEITIENCSDNIYKISGEAVKQMGDNDSIGYGIDNKAALPFVFLRVFNSSGKPICLFFYHNKGSPVYKVEKNLFDKQNIQKEFAGFLEKGKIQVKDETYTLAKPHQA